MNNPFNASKLLLSPRIKLVVRISIYTYTYIYMDIIHMYVFVTYKRSTYIAYL